MKKKSLLISMTIICFSGFSQPTVTSNFFMQSWIRYIENNAGTADEYGNSMPYSFDFIIRRVRAIAQIETSKQDLFFVHVGVNDIHETSEKPTIFLHELWYKYQLVRNEFTELTLGFGQHSWNGPSRISNLSLLQMGLAEFPASTVPFLGERSTLGRQVGFFAHGSFGNLIYRLNASRPFDSHEGIYRGKTKDIKIREMNRHNFSYGAYLYYAFIDKEDQRLANLPSTYFGKKRIYNIGFGCYLHPRSFESYDGGNQTGEGDLLVVSGDLFYDMPVSPTSALNIYLLWQKDLSSLEYYRSTRYLSSIYGVYKGYTGVQSSDGFGNAQPLTGTGNLFESQLAYYKQIDAERRNGIQAYIVLTLKNLTLVSQSLKNWDFGTSMFLGQLKYKLGIQYSLRPEVIEQAGKLKHYQHRGEWYINFHFFI